MMGEGVQKGGSFPLITTAHLLDGGGAGDGSRTHDNLLGRQGLYR